MFIVLLGLILAASVQAGDYKHKKHTTVAAHTGANGRFTYTDGIYIRMYDPMSDGNIFFKRLPVRFEGYMPLMIFNWIDIYSKKYYQSLKEALVKQLGDSDEMSSVPEPPNPKVTRKNYRPDAVVNTRAPRKEIKDIRKTLKTIHNIQNPNASMSVKNRPIIKVLENEMPGTKKAKRKQEKIDRDVITKARRAARKAAAEHLPPSGSN